MRIPHWLWLAVLLFGAQALAKSAAGPQSEAVALESFAEGAGPPLVMLGGGTLGAAEFAPHAHGLATDFRVIRLQTLNIARAQARQPLPAAYSVKIESAAMTRSLDQLGLALPVHLVGHSFGALVALDFALDHPNRVRTLVLAEPPAFWVVSPEERQASADMRMMDALLRTFGPTAEPTDDQLLRFQCALGNCGTRAPMPTEPAWVDWVSRRSALRGLSVVANHADQISRLRSFPRPVLIITGSNTVSFHRRINDLLATSLPLAERAELPGGHAATSTAPEEFVKLLSGFLARHP